MTHSEDESVVHGELLALRLRNVEIVTLSMGSRVTRDKFVGGVVAGMHDGKGEGEWVGDVLDGMHEDSTGHADV